MSQRPLNVCERVPLAPLTTLQVGGDARFFLDVRDTSDLANALAWGRSAGLPTVVLGGGSNVLVSDRGVDALVLRMRACGVRTTEMSDGEALMTVSAGEPLDTFVAKAVADGYAGLECLSGIPGTVGATPIQNVGAYGQEVAQTIREVVTVDRLSGAVHAFDNAACAFAYRSSIFKERLRDAHVVTSVSFELRRTPTPVVRYAELSRTLHEQVQGAPTLADVRGAVLAIRRAKSMVIDQADPNHRSAGSFFVNPVVSVEGARAVEEAARSRSVDPSRAMPRFISEAGVKLSAAWLIEQAGFAKGMADGPVGISTRHALCIVNRGGATSRQVVAFAARVRAEVRAQFGVPLATEPVRLGFAPADEAGLVD